MQQMREKAGGGSTAEVTAAIGRNTVFNSDVAFSKAKGH